MPETMTDLQFNEYVKLFPVADVTPFSNISCIRHCVNLKFILVCVYA